MRRKLVERARRESRKRREYEERRQNAKRKWGKIYPIWEWLETLEKGEENERKEM